MPTKLIEVALPLDAINAAAAREKSIRHGHPSTLHLWWARRPLAACRAVLFASLVDDPGADPTLSAEEVVAKRDELFALIEDLVKWENSNNPAVLARARAAILASTGGHPPPVLDPFCGGGSIPLEAQRLGLEAHGSDLNPVAVLITKALIEIPPKFAGQAPINPTDRAKIGSGSNWPGATGLAADVRHYGAWMRDEAHKRIGHLYPKATLPPERGGGEATVIAWLWARTVKCPNPACGAEMPLVSSFWLSTKATKKAWVEPVVDQNAKTVSFRIETGAGPAPDPPKLGRGGRFRCLVCNQSASEDHIKAEGQEHRIGAQLMAVVAEGNRERVYLAPSDDQVGSANHVQPPEWLPSGNMPNNPRWFSPPAYGMTSYADLFTPRQLVALTTFSDLVGEARQRARQDALAAGRPADGLPLNDGGTGATAYADAVATYLAFALSKMADRGSTICTWFTERDSTRNTFARQAIPMTWDFAELNTLLRGTGSFLGAIEWTAESLDGTPKFNVTAGIARQADAVHAKPTRAAIYSTDPPYYDNVGYADLSDFFYVWLRHSLMDTYPNLFSTLLTPKSEELVATPYRFKGGKAEAQRFFESGVETSFSTMRTCQDPDYPLTVYYAFKQSEQEVTDSGGLITASTGWETMLEGLIQAGFGITATWPMRTELSNRMIGRGTNALASSIVLACRIRPEHAATTTRGEFLRELRRKLPGSLRTMQQASIAPVDLAQAAIGPGMAIYSAYAAVLEPGGERLRVRTALQLINQVRDEALSEQDSEYDRETGWAIDWFSQYGMAEAEYGVAETLANARAVSVEGLRQAGIIRSGRGRVRLIPRAELPADWNPASDARLTDWEVAQHLIRALETGGREAAGTLRHQAGGRADVAKDLAYRLYTICERKGWSQEALSYNGLVVDWPELVRIAVPAAGARVEQQRFGSDGG
ncbi:MAG: DUF1156 domain-containing protein [Chloroflexota bacterium]|nr:DUF1156 domain-containing protein [Chloroflexota bacterium]